MSTAKAVPNPDYVVDSQAHILPAKLEVPHRPLAGVGVVEGNRRVRERLAADEVLQCAIGPQSHLALVLLRAVHVVLTRCMINRGNYRNLPLREIKLLQDARRNER